MLGIDRLFLASSSGESSFIATLAGANTSGFGNVCVDDQGSIYFNAKANDTYVVKLDADGAIVWQRAITGPYRLQRIAVASDYEVYITGDRNMSHNFGWLGHLDANGVLLYQRYFTDYPSTHYYGLAIGSDDLPYVVGDQDPVKDKEMLVAKLTRSATINTNPVRHYSTQYDVVGKALAMDGSNNLYILGTVHSAVLLLKMVNWAVTATTQLTTQSVGQPVDVGVDASGNIYAITTFGLIKFDTSLTVTWMRTLNNGTSNVTWKGLAVDADGNCYITGYYGSGSYFVSVLAKYDSAGVLQWQRSLSQNHYVQAFSVTVANGCVYVGGALYDSVAPAWRSFICKLPDDGSLTGVYTVGGIAITYAAASLIDAAGAPASASFATVEGATSNATTATTFTDAAASLTPEVTTL